MTNKKSINHDFSKFQVTEIVNCVRDVYGSDLSTGELDESIYLVLENVPGIELISTHKIQSLILEIRNQYHDKSESSK